MLKHVIWDKDTQEADIRASGLDWTIVRPPRLLHTPEINPDVVVWSGPQPKRKTRLELPRGLRLRKVVLDALSGAQYIGQAVNLCLTPNRRKTELPTGFVPEIAIRKATDLAATVTNPTRQL